MEEQFNKKPCVVQKIETPQGFSVSYKERFLYSKYNPSKNILNAIDALQIFPGTIILCNSPLLGYGLFELLNKLPDNCLIVLCEAEPELYEFSINEEYFKNLNTARIISCSPSELPDLPLRLYDLAKYGKYKRVIKLDMSAGIQFNIDLYNKLFASCTDSIMTFWKNRITLTRFGRRYSKNLFENLHYLSDSIPITSYFNSVNKPIIVFGAGESTQTFIDRFLSCTSHTDESILSNYFILCADTALQPLLQNGITPDGVFIEEAQSVIVKAFTGTKKDIHIFAGLSSIPNLVHFAGANNISYFFTEYTDGIFFESLKSKSFMPPANKPFGSVGLTAVYYALKFRKDDTVPVYVTGLDFSYSAGITHTKGALAHRLRLANSNRLLPVANYGAAFSYGTEKIKDKQNQDFYTTVTLKNYAAMFNSFFGDVKNLFDAGESGIKLQIQHVNCFLTNASVCLPVLQENMRCNICHCDSEDQRNPYAIELNRFLTTEHNALEHLRDLLTGNTTLNGDSLIEEIKKLATPREYLYLHFADGCQFSTDQSFLNRIRTEIDFFLKYI